MSSVQTDGADAPQIRIVKFNPVDRRHFIGGSDARVILGNDEADLVRLWREKRGEIEPQDFSDNLVVQLGTVTEALNRTWYQRSTGQTVKDVQKRMRHPVHKWMAATLDGIVEETGAVFEAKFMLPWSFTEEAAAEKHMAQLQHNMWVLAARSAVLSIITGGGKWVEIKLHADPLYQHLLLTAEKKFWRCVQTGEPPRLFGIEAPRPRLEAVKVVDMASSDLWAELAATYLRTRDSHAEHETAKAELKKLVPEDAKEASGHGIRAKRSKSGAISFDATQTESTDAPVQ
ncbi:YqaJ viral recombinase family protein [Bradyrhizobium cenepequi]|uniref:YqaJ viral recombinase family protein n=1 Tax=Bradyrhizobium cenepequi TaxID=2821403 RepID=UPI001CE383B7|nr:YqaJ viral recombinase family protein [Bradyrhizobium cenepequi]MCA6106964.1 YqaJ viral recombinase family protein [Bradyrhizobium cenepequi]